MRDLDNTNVYSYKGKYITQGLLDYLVNEGINIVAVKLVNGCITVQSDKREFVYPQFVPWGKIAENIKEVMDLLSRNEVD